MKNMYKSIYDHISLGEAQKAEIWNNITRAAGEENTSFAAQTKRKHMPLRAAACAALLACSGMAAFASVNSRTDRIADSMMLWNPNQDTATAQQKELYAQYIAEDAFILNGPTGKFVIDGIMYDHAMICMPYTYYPNTPLGEPGTQTAETQRLWLDSDIRFRTQNETRDPGDYSYLSMFGRQDPVIQEDGTLKGIFMVYQNIDLFEAGDVIECCLFPAARSRKLREVTEEDTIGDDHILLTENGRCYEAEYIPPEVLHSFTLHSAMDSLDFVSEPVSLTSDLILDRALLSSFTLNLTAHYECDLTGLSHYDISFSPAIQTIRERSLGMISQACIVMKDGSAVSFTAPSGSENYDPEKSWTVGYTLLLEEPISLADAQWLRIPDIQAKSDDAYLWIPLH